MPMSPEQTRILDALAVQLWACDPDLARRLTGPVLDAGPAGGRIAVPPPRRPDDETVDFLRVLAAVILGVAPLVIGLYAHAPVVIALGALVAVVLPVAATWWVNTAPRRLPAGGADGTVGPRFNGS